MFLDKIIYICRKRKEEQVKDLQKKQDGCQESMAKLKQEFDQLPPQPAANA